MWHDIWKNSGRPGSCKLKYKSAIKKPSVTTKINIMMNSMNIFSTKKYQNFGNVGTSKFHKIISKEVYINGSNKDVDIENAFAAQFSSVYCSSDDAADAKKELEALLSGANNDDFSKERLCELINVESVDRCMQNLKLGKALGPDGLNAEHLR